MTHTVDTRSHVEIKQLEVGDKVLMGYYGRFDTVLSVERVTPTTAIADRYVLARAYTSEHLHPKRRMSGQTFKIATPEAIAMIEHKETILRERNLVLDLAGSCTDPELLTAARTLLQGTDKIATLSELHKKCREWFRGDLAYSDLENAIETCTAKLGLEADKPGE